MVIVKWEFWTNDVFCVMINVNQGHLSVQETFYFAKNHINLDSSWVILYFSASFFFGAVLGFKDIFWIKLLIGLLKTAFIYYIKMMCSMSYVYIYRQRFIRLFFQRTVSAPWICCFWKYLSHRYARILNLSNHQFNKTWLYTAYWKCSTPGWLPAT